MLLMVFLVWSFVPTGRQQRQRLGLVDFGARLLRGFLQIGSGVLRGFGFAGAGHETTLSTNASTHRIRVSQTAQ